jgi:replicative DNA helicase
MSSKGYNGLPLIKTFEAIDSSKKRINDERSGEQLGMYCRWGKLNKAMLKYWRFNHVTMIGGMSGSGKSFILNMLRTDFLDNEDWRIPISNMFNLGSEAIQAIYDEKQDKFHLPKSPIDEQDVNCIVYPEARLWKKHDDDDYYYHRALNRDSNQTVVALHFGYEMDPEDELIRAASSIVGVSYGYIMSSTTELIDGQESYVYLNDNEYNVICNALDLLKGRKEYYVSLSGNVVQMMNTVKAVYAANPGCKLLVTIDHTLLSKKLNEKDDAELQASIARFALDIRQLFGCAVILLNQLNQSIEKTERRTKPVLHYPIKSDIHLGAQIWWACDNVIIFHRPSLLNIDRYGVYKLNTKNLVHGAVIKSRKGQTGDIYLENKFNQGRLIQKSSKYFQ